MRGKQVLGVEQDCNVRITPAHAGKTCPPLWYIYSIEDHPRACGENRRLSVCLSSAQGSPPRMRGKPTRFEVSHERDRITPAHAGKTFGEINDVMVG